MRLIRISNIFTRERDEQVAMADDDVQFLYIYIARFTYHLSYTLV